MTDRIRIGNLARPLAPLAPEDTLARAATMLRAAPYDAVPVVINGQVAGMIDSHTLAAAAESLAAPETHLAHLRWTSVENLPLTQTSVLPADMPIAEAMASLRRTGRALPVVSENGTYLGMVDAADVAAFLLKTDRPASIGGMATPLGVYLTTGTVSAGARGSLGLVLTGASLGALLVAVGVVLSLLAQGLERLTGVPIQAAMLSVPVQWLALNPYDIWRHVLPVVGLAIFGVLFRWLPLTRYHAAEHQVVHAIERDRPLTVESVSAMPRVHPRCGTRFFAAGVLLTLFGTGLPISVAWVRYAVAAIAIAAWWRALGYHLQNYVTTRDASEKQIQSAIQAAEELLSKYYSTPRHRPSLVARIWHTGLVQVAGGAYAAGSLLSYGASLSGVPLLFP